MLTLKIGVVTYCALVTFSAPLLKSGHRNPFRLHPAPAVLTRPDRRLAHRRLRRGITSRRARGDTRGDEVRMDVPILTAVIGVGGSLMGTIIGGCLTMYSNFLLNRRRERAEFRIGCRLIAGELGENHALVTTLLRRRRWSFPDLLEPGTETWKEHRHVLASYLPSEAWRDLQWAVLAVHQARFLWTNARMNETEEIDDAGAQLLTGLVEQIARGRTSLQPYLEKPRRRLLQPLRTGPAVP